MSIRDFNIPVDFGKLANARLLPATITAVYTDNTLDITCMGIAIAGASHRYHCHHQHDLHGRWIFLEGDAVLCLYTGQGEAPSVDNVEVLAFPAGELRDCLITGFLAHPRTDTHPFGVNNAGNDLGIASIFPLIDNDQGSALIDPNAAGTASREESVENYGNIADTTNAYSWRGPSGMLIPNDPTVAVPGFTQEDGLAGLTQLYTPFGSQIYQGGALLQTISGTKVLCAGLFSGELRAVVQESRSGITTDVLYARRDNAWVEITSRASTTATTPCEMLPDGTVLFKAGTLTPAGAWSAFTAASGTRTADGTNWNRSGLVGDTVLRALVGGIVTEYAGEIQIVDQTTDTKTGDKTTATAQLHVPPYTITVSGPFDIVAGSQYTQSGGLGGGTWSISSGSIDATTGVVTNPGCGTVTVTYTETICGTIAGSKTCKAASGHWVNVGSAISWPYQGWQGGPWGSCSGTVHTWPLGQTYQGAPFQAPGGAVPSGAVIVWGYTGTNYGCSMPCGDVAGNYYIGYNSPQNPGNIWNGVSCFSYQKMQWECLP